MSNPNHEEELYAQAAAELEDGNRDEGLWAKCFAECDGEENRAKARYIKTQAERLPKKPKLLKLLPYAIVKLIGFIFGLIASGCFIFGVFLISNEILIFIFGETIADKPPHDMYGPDRRIPDLSLWIYFPLITLLGVVISTPFILALARYVFPHIERLDDWVEKKLQID